jgi:tellurite resistance protein
VSRVEQLKAAFGVIHILPLEREDAERILELAQLVVDVDGQEQAEELGLYFSVGKLLFALAEAPDANVPTFASDEEDDQRMFELATSLRSTEARELAFAVARTLAEADLEIGPEETKLVEQLRSLLSISRERAEELDTLLRSA